jgi:hypothetical protein
MIKINVRKLSLTSGNNLQNMPIMLANNLAEELKKKLEGSLKNKVCSDHPNEINSISIIADKRGIPKIEKGIFCCEEFSKSIQFNF